ncbi:bifunctional oligoribonuclease/PAP phosphatase NrnA [Amycolatopsis sp. 195334CR]|uniref:DHH family phosphoesterase n=1 Tax=Amycolatopsis sp. 195334CR TaxID=2814588 RepID=UPI001A8D733E|nr:bifunctional oligoribonuclease/PAP phosphatase NrnA [Amycolatopsis sp. 195334CR]MBN6037873.1 bifunctional oligoribonuclease/PAP phosphatase NrnA [Amycolatopsis sp. 195334CR]
MTTSQLDVDRAGALLRGSADVLILSHVRPDADTLGSALALGRVLHRRGATVRVSYSGDSALPDSLRSLDPGGLFVPEDQLPDHTAQLVTVDVASAARLGGLAGRVEATRAAGGEVLVIDHHASNPGFGTLNLIDAGAEATVVLVLAVIDALGEELDPVTASCLYAGLISDTAMFRLARPDTHRMAVRLLEAGVDPAPLTREVVDERPFASLAMLGSVLGDARFEPDAAQGHGLVHTAVTADLAATVRPEEVEGVIDLVRTVREAGVAVVLKEVAGPSPEWTVSLRSAGRLDVSAVAVALGGGGHKLAAGCTLTGSADQVMEQLRAELAKAPLL